MPVNADFGCLFKKKRKKNKTKKEKPTLHLERDLSPPVQCLD